MSQGKIYVLIATFKRGWQKIGE